MGWGEEGAAQNIQRGLQGGQLPPPPLPKRNPVSDSANQLCHNVGEIESYSTHETAYSLHQRKFDQLKTVIWHSTASQYLENSTACLATKQKACYPPPPHPPNTPVEERLLSFRNLLSRVVCSYQYHVAINGPLSDLKPQGSFHVSQSSTVSGQLKQSWYGVE